MSNLLYDKAVHHDVKWCEVKDGQEVFIKSTPIEQGKEVQTVVGPYIVYNKKERALCKAMSSRWFIHYPEELVKGESEGKNS